MPFTTTISRAPQRWVVCALCSWAVAIISYKNRCITEITDIVRSVSENETSSNEGCPYFFISNTCPLRKQMLLSWLPEIYFRPRILRIAGSAHFTGKLLMVVPAGLLSDFGYSRIVLGGGILLVVVSHLLLPTVAKWGVTAFVLQNIAEGVGEAVLFPSVISLISRWALSSERNTFTVLVFAGYYYGDILGHLVFSLIYMRFGIWSMCAYTTGTVGLVWLALWFIFGYHSPADSPFISALEYFAIARDQRFPLYTLKRIPWKNIVSSRPFLSLILIYCSLKWAINIIIFGILDYYEHFMWHLPDQIKINSSIIVNATLPSSLVGGLLIDWAIKHKLVSKTVINRVFVFISVFFSTVLSVMTPLASCNWILFLVLSVTAVYTSGLADSTVYSSPIDLSPLNAGLLMGIMTGATYICILFNFKIDEILEPDRINPYQWWGKVVFCALLALAMMIPYIFFGSGEQQRWNRYRLKVAHSANQPPIELENTENPEPHKSS